MNICIDIGNTFTKTAVFDIDTLVDFNSFSEFGFTEFEALIKKYEIKKGIISSVRNDNLSFNPASILESLIVLDSDTKIPIVNRYETPETLGKDRLAAAIGANFLYPSNDVLVIDAGSAITFDFINANGEYKGGNIAPGLTMRFKALHEFTSSLPLLTSADDIPFIGTNTKEAIIAGVQNSVTFETDTYINLFNNLFPGMITLITGGDANFFDNKLKNTIFVIPNLVLIGLNRILNFNA